MARVIRLDRIKARFDERRNRLVHARQPRVCQRHEAVGLVYPRDDLGGRSADARDERRSSASKPAFEGLIGRLRVTAFAPAVASICPSTRSCDRG
jgi:hypothetical protein